MTSARIFGIQIKWNIDFKVSIPMMLYVTDEGRLSVNKEHIIQVRLGTIHYIWSTGTVNAKYTRTQPVSDTM